MITLQRKLHLVKVPKYLKICRLKLMAIHNPVAVPPFNWIFFVL